MSRLFRLKNLMRRGHVSILVLIKIAARTQLNEDIVDLKASFDEQSP